MSSVSVVSPSFRPGQSHYAWAGDGLESVFFWEAWLTIRLNAAGTSDQSIRKAVLPKSAHGFILLMLDARDHPVYIDCCFLTLRRLFNTD